MNKLSLIGLIGVASACFAQSNPVSEVQAALAREDTSSTFPGGKLLQRHDGGPTPVLSADKATGFDKQVETAHFIIEWRTTETSAAEVETAKTQAELFFARISKYIGADRTPTEKMIVLLEGEARQQADERRGLSKGGYRIPHVDHQGRIHLYRYFGNYFEALSHEMVHAFRMQTKHWKDGFFEEGFASLIGDTLQPDKKGFPRYGFPLTVVAGHWVASGEDIPLATLKEKHREISLKCMAQSYSLRSSFFKYLQRQYGDAPILNLAYGDEPASYQRYRAVFGKPFDMLAAAWRVDLLDRFRAFEQGAQLARQYRTNTPVQNWLICQAGEDYWVDR